MNDLAPAYLSALATQVGALSAFLGGFAATFLGTLITLERRQKTVGMAIGFAAVASVSFIAAVVSSTLITAVLHPDAPVTPSTSPVVARVVLGLGFFGGLYTLLASLGLSGWSRSRSTGRTTTVVAALGALVVTWLVLSAGA